MRLAHPEREGHRQRTPEHGDAQRDRKAAQSAVGSTPPKSDRISSTGSVQASIASTGTSRAASLPSTISAAERSVISMCASVPRARSRQIAPAVAAGAARSTSESCVPITARKNPRPARPGNEAPTRRTVRFVFIQMQNRATSKQRARTAIAAHTLPAPRRRDPLVDEDRAQADSAVDHCALLVVRRQLRERADRNHDRVVSAFSVLRSVLARLLQQSGKGDVDNDPD